MNYQAVNWNIPEDNFTQIFWNQFVKQFWIDTEIGIAKDRKQWNLMTPEEKDVFKKNFAALTLFDTLQSEVGMPSIKEMVPGSQRKAVLGFMEMMESIHAKSYSTIFTTLMEKFEIDELFEWSKENRFLQYKVSVVKDQYELAKENKAELYLAMVASVYLESFLFYSGFFYPLYLAGEGRMTATADMINLIIRDEAVHGVYVGMLAQELYQELSDQEKEYVDKAKIDMLEDLVANEIVYTHEVYGQLGMASEVVEFVKYNANKALNNLGFEGIYENVSINPIVEVGLDTDTKSHDFFSKKGNGYIKAQIEDLQDEDFAPYKGLLE